MKILKVGLAFSLAGLIAVLHFLGEELDELIESYREELVSFSAGASVTYIFLQLLPELHRITVESNHLIFFFPLAGFASIHLAEKYLAKSGLEQDRVLKDYGEIHSVFLFLYHSAIGYLISSLVVENTVSGLLFFLPIILHVAVSSFSVTELHQSFMRKLPVKIAISSAPLLGVLAHSFGAFSDSIFHPIFGTVIGMFFYIVMRDSMPQGEKGKPTEFLAGVLLYSAVILSAISL